MGASFARLLTPLRIRQHHSQPGLSVRAQKIRQYCAGTCLLDSCLRSPAGLCMQSNIDAEGFRSLRENEAVEFFVEEGEDGRTKAVNVTGPDGAPPQVWSFK